MRRDKNAPGAEPHRTHPWQGIDPGAGLPVLVTAHIEVVLTDPVKYEVDKISRVQRRDTLV